jgi:hypothetical protein
MKKLCAVLVIQFFMQSLTAQVPKLFNYQAVARNSTGVALANTAIKLRLTINEVSGVNVTPLYSETRSVTTNALGLFNVQVGAPGAISSTGTMDSGDWLSASLAHQLKVEIDIANGNTFTDMGSQTLVSVPYAFAADNSKSTTALNDIEVSTTPPTNGQALMYNSGTGKWQASTPTSSGSGILASVFTSGYATGTGGTTPIADTQNFLGNAVSVTVSGTLDKIYVSANAALGAGATGANSLNLYIGHRLGAGGIVVVGNGIFGLTCPPSQRLSYGLSAIITGLSAGTYSVGLVGVSSNVNWTNNEFVYTSVMVFR